MSAGSHLPVNEVVVLPCLLQYCFELLTWLQLPICAVAGCLSGHVFELEVCSVALPACIFTCLHALNEALNPSAFVF